MSIRTTILALTAAMMTLHAGAAFKQTGLWHINPTWYNYYRWNSKGSMVFVKGYCSNIFISAFITPDNQWGMTVPYMENTSTARVYVADNFKNLLVHTKAGTTHQLHSFSMNTTLTLLRNAGFSAETGEFGPPEFSWAGKDLFVAQRMTAAGSVLVGLVSPTLDWKMNIAVQTWTGWTEKSTPVSISPRGKYLAVERAFNVGNYRGTLDVYKTGATLKKMGETTFADSISWIRCPQDKFLMCRTVMGPPSVWVAAKIGSLDIFCTKSDGTYSSWMVSPAGKGSAALYTSAKTISVRSGDTFLGPYAITDAQAGDSLILMYFDGKTVVFAFANGPSTKLRAYHVTAQALKLVAGPVDCGTIMYADHGKGYFAFSDFVGVFTVYTPRLKVIGQTTGGIPEFKERAALLPNFTVIPNEFKIFRW